MPKQRNIDWFSVGILAMLAGGGVLFYLAISIPLGP